MASRPLPNPYPPNSSESSTSSYDQSGSSYYHDIESLTLTLGKPRPGRKSSKDNRPKSSIWTVSSESEKINTLAKKSKNNSAEAKAKKNSNNKSSIPIPVNPSQRFNSKKSSPVPAVFSNQRFNSKSKPTTPILPNNERFLKNPVFENELKNWTLPRVELKCRDPTCIYNQNLWGNHLQHSPILFSTAEATILEVEEEESEENSVPTYNKSQDNNTPQDIYNASTMVLNQQHRQRGQMHLNMAMGINNFGSKEGITITHTNSNKPPAPASTNPTGRTNNKGLAMTQTPTDTIASSITSNSNTDSTMLTIHTGSSKSEESAIPSPEGSSSGFITGFDTSTTTSTGSRSGSSRTGDGGGIILNPSNKPFDGHDIGNNPRNNHSIATGHCVYSQTNNTPYQPFRTPSSASSSNPYCPNCSGVVPLNHLDNASDIGHGGRLKGDPGFWHFNKFQHPLQRDHSFHSVGGFTLNGQYNTIAKKHTMVKFCSSHKISLVVSTFSLIVTIGLLITLFLMKKRGMMDTMMDS